MSSPRERAALLGIAERSVRVKYVGNIGNKNQVKTLKANVKTLGDWLRFKRMEKNLTQGHVAAKMGIASAIVCSWESGAKMPDSQQMAFLATVLGFDPAASHLNADIGSRLF